MKWKPEFNEETCGCEVVFKDNTVESWNKSSSHKNIDIKELKKLNIDANIARLSITEKEKVDLKAVIYSKHAI